MTSLKDFVDGIEDRSEVCIETIAVEDVDAEFGGHEARRRLEHKLLRKIDLRMSILIVIYILNYMDRNNIAAARLRGFETDLGLKGQQFATLLSILYVGYMIMQIPSNMILNHIGKPSIYLPVCMTIWGVLSILTGQYSIPRLLRSLGLLDQTFPAGITKNFVGALLTRFFLGFLGTRVALFICGNIVSNAFGALAASAILDRMGGKLGQAAWRWLFYIEGALTVFVALCAVFVLPDFPATTRWLSEEERRLAMRRMEEDAGIGDEEVTEAEAGPGAVYSAGLRLAVRDWKVWWMAVSVASGVVATSFNAYFPTLSATMGFGPTVTLLLCAPPWVLAALSAFAVSMFYHVTIPCFVGIVGFVVAICTMNTAARYVSLVLTAQSYAGYAVQFTWVSNSFASPPSKRAVVLAFINAFSEFGDIAGSYTWPSAWGPSYRKSYAICIATAASNIVMCYVFRLHLTHLNRELEKEETRKGVKDKGFRYLI